MALLRKTTCNLRHPMDLRHPVRVTSYVTLRKMCLLFVSFIVHMTCTWFVRKTWDFFEFVYFMYRIHYVYHHVSCWVVCFMLFVLFIVHVTCMSSVRKICWGLFNFLYFMYSTYYVYHHVSCWFVCFMLCVSFIVHVTCTSFVRKIC